MTSQLSSNHYGKSDVRLTKIIRNGAQHELVEYSVDIQLTGDFARSYTHGDNTQIIATDSMKNTVYVLAKENQFASAEAFAVLLAEHFPKTYSHVQLAKVDVRQVNWQRIGVNGTPHDHAFVSGGADLHTAVALSQRGASTSISGGIAELAVVKTTRSAFKGFVTDRYRTLKDADDRIFGTAITASWQYASTAADFPASHQKIKNALLTTFATHTSYAVQETMFEMGKAALAVTADIRYIRLRLPNKHRLPINLQPFGLENNNEIFVWTDEPYGDISAFIERE